MSYPGIGNTLCMWVGACIHLKLNRKRFYSNDRKTTRNEVFLVRNIINLWHSKFYAVAIVSDYFSLLFTFLRRHSSGTIAKNKNKVAPVQKHRPKMSRVPFKVAVICNRPHPQNQNKGLYSTAHAKKLQRIVLFGVNVKTYNKKKKRVITWNYWLII